ncbi:fibronectin type III domain-containing protein [Arthrobacter alpinus]|nr:fibronectin type III domain-containing protein [Arthrobacter alpinus]
MQAINKAPNPSEWGAYSASVIPAGVPGVPVVPTVQTNRAVGSNSQVSVSWSQPFINGDPISKYEVERSGGGQAPVTQTVTGLSTTFSVGTSTEGYQYRVRATNKAGTTAWGGMSSPQRALGKISNAPQAPGITLVGTNAAGGQVKVTYNALAQSQLNGYASSEVQYCVTLSTGAASCGVPSGVVMNSPNGTNVYANVYAQPTSNAGDRSDTSGASATVNPFGVPGQTGVNGSTAGAEQKTVSWNWTTPGANGRAITRYEISLNNAGWTSVGMNGSYSTGTANYNDSANLNVRACNEGGCGAASGNVTSRAGSAPPPPVTEWSITHTRGSNTCMDALGSTNWDGQTCSGGHWLNPGQTIVTNCYVWRNGSFLVTGTARSVDPMAVTTACSLAGTPSAPTPPGSRHPRCPPARRDLVSGDSAVNHQPSKARRGPGALMTSATGPLALSTPDFPAWAAGVAEFPAFEQTARDRHV